MSDTGVFELAGKDAVNATIKKEAKSIRTKKMSEGYRDEL